MYRLTNKKSSILPSLFRNFLTTSKIPLPPSPFSTSTSTSTTPPPPASNPFLVNHLVNTLGISRSQAISSSNIISSNTLTNPTNSDSPLALVEATRENLWKGRPERKLTIGKRRIDGRNNKGRTTIWHRGGGHKQLYRIIDFKREVIDVKATVVRIEYDPNRSTFIALVKYDDGRISYILAPHKLNVGDTVVSSESGELTIGNCMPLKSVPIGVDLHNVELKPGKGGQIARSAGNFVNLVSKDEKFAKVKLPSGKFIFLPVECKGTIGMLSNPGRKNLKLRKAGQSRWLGKRPVVRGVAMNPVDHPHGGGEGKTGGGKHAVTPWGKPTHSPKGKKVKNTASKAKKERKEKKKQRKRSI